MQQTKRRIWRLVLALCVSRSPALVLDSVGVLSNASLGGRSSLRGGGVPSTEHCKAYPWWNVLSGVQPPLWPHVKAFQVASGSGNWSGRDKARLDHVDAQTAREYVGSAWGTSGYRQLQTAQHFMGVQPSDRLLEIGCGAFNAGQYFIHALEAKKYTCVEPNKELHQQSIAAEPWLQKEAVVKQPRFVDRDDFDPRPATGAAELFDRSWSHSILSHAADWQLLQYFEVMAATLKPGTGLGMASIRFSDHNGVDLPPSHSSHWVYPGVSIFDFEEANCMATIAGLGLKSVPEARTFMTQVVPAEFHDWIIMWRLNAAR